MSEARIRLAPGVPGLASLGAASFDDFFRVPGAPGFERAEIVRAHPGFELVRYPLPGTPDASGRLSGGAPRGAGTGWLWLERWSEVRFRERWRARLSHPRSTSLAEREWNLVCHLRAAGLATPEPLAVGRGEGGVFARRSFLVLRELEDLEPLSAWARQALDSRAQARIARALGRALARLFRSGARLPELGLDTIWAGTPRNTAAGRGGEECVARTIESLRAASRGIAAPARERAQGDAGLGWGRLPEIAFFGFRGGRIGPPVPPAERTAVLLRLARELPDLGPDLGRRVAFGATADLGRSERRSVLSALAREPAPLRR